MPPLSPPLREVSSRLPAIDALRGFALLGVLLLNMLVFSGPPDRIFGQPLETVPWPWSYGAILVFVQGKFYGLFALLFGFGFGIQLDRFQARGEHPGRRFRRRLAVLFLFGILHGVLLWMGDILAMYALLGLLLPAFARCRPRTLLIWAGSLLLLLVLVGGAIALINHSSSARDPQAVAQTFARQSQALDRHIQESLHVHRTGPYGALFLWRIKELLRNYLQTLAMTPHILAMFLLGLWSHRTGLVKHLAERRDFLKRLARAGLLVGLPANLLYAYLLGQGFTAEGHSRALFAYALYPVACPALTLGYAASLLLLLQRWETPLASHLAAAGRLSLTNYLLQSLVMTTIFEFYGLGLYGNVPLPGALAMGFALWGLQLVLSHLWLKRAPQGPLEALWRRLAFGRSCA